MVMVLLLLQPSTKSTLPFYPIIQIPQIPPENKTKPPPTLAEG